MPIQTFNDGDFLQDIRVNKLNPAISKINQLEDGVGNITTDLILAKLKLDTTATTVEDLIVKVDAAKAECDAAEVAITDNTVKLEKALGDIDRLLSNDASLNTSIQNLADTTLDTVNKVIELQAEDVKLKDGILSNVQLINTLLSDVNTLQSDVYSLVNAIPKFSFGVTQTDTVDTTYALTTANVPQTLPLNTLNTSSSGASYCSIDNATDTLKISQPGTYWLSYNAHVVKPQTGQQTKYSTWLEVSYNNGSTWTYIPGSSYILVLPADLTTTPNPISISLPFEATSPNFSVRGRQVASNVSNGVGIKSYSQSGIFQATSAWRLVGHKVE